MKKSLLPPPSNPSIEALDQKYELVDIDTLKRHPDNPRRSDVEQIALSIKANGFYGAVLAQKSTRYVLVGNHRWEAAKSEGFKSIPVIWLDIEDKAAKRIMLADNRTSDIGGYDEEALAAILLELRAGDELAGTGYGEIDLGELLKSMGDALIEASGVEPEEIKKAKKASSEGLEFRIVVDCESELQQTELMDRFEAEGLHCRPLIS